MLGMVMDDDQERHAMLAIQTKKPVPVSDAFNDERFNCEHLRKYNIRSVLVTAVIVKDEAIGVVFFTNQRAVFESNRLMLILLRKLRFPYLQRSRMRSFIKIFGTRSLNGNGSRQRFRE